MSEVAYWNVNAPEQEWTDQCPDYLRDVDHWDRAQLGVRDSDYELMPWEEVRNIVRMRAEPYWMNKN